MSEKTRIVVLGGGYAGVHAAKKLLKTFKRNRDKVEIALIDKNIFHTLMTELHEVAGERVDEEAVKISFKRIFAGRNIEIIHDTIETIDFSNKVLKSLGAEYTFDYLIIGTGAESTDFGIPGVAEHSLPLWGLADALRIRSHVREMFVRATTEKKPDMRKALLTFVVAGGGFTGVEMMGELVEWIPLLCEEYEIHRDDVELILVEGLGKILNMISDKPREKAMKYLEKKGVKVMLNSLISEARFDGFTTRKDENIQTRTLIWTCGIKGSAFGESLGLTEGKVGRKRVNEYMQSPDYENVYLVGDGMWFLEDEKPVPQIVEAAEQTAATAVHNMAIDIKTRLGIPVKDSKESFKSKFHGFMVSIGGRYAVSATMGIEMSGFFAQGLKHLVNLIYQSSVCGVNAIWGYLKHEILDIKNRRSLIGSFATYKIPSYWTIVLRLFLGGMWLYEGIKKIGDGWLSDKAGSFVYQAADALTAASDAGEWAAETAVQYAEPLIANPTMIYTWVSETFVSLAPYFFQVMIVLAEIAMGLCFIGGLFTFLAAVASIGLSIMLILGAMASREILWFMACAVVMMGGAGRAFGLDYWVMPWLRNFWNGTRLAQRTYLYIGEPVRRKKKKS